MKMNKELKNTVKDIVNKHYTCKECKHRKYCDYGEGENLAFDCSKCTADDFANGVYATLDYLAYIPWDKAMNVIASSCMEDEE